jgi:RNA recognition motif-containing protein
LAVRLFVGNLSYATTEADLRTYFGTVAAPSQVVLPVDRETGRPRGFAFVEFLDRANAEQAIQKFNGQMFNGRPLAVSEARAREDRGPGGFSGPRPGGGGFSGPRPSGGGFGGPRPGGGGFGGPRFDQSGPSPSRARNFGPDAKPSKGPGAKKTKKDAERPRGPIPTKFTGRSFSLDDDKDAVSEELPDIDDFATSQPEDKKIADDDGGDE